MRKILLVAGLLVATAAAAAGGINLATGTNFDFTDCSSAGSAAQTLTAGTYLFRVMDKDTFVCLAASGSTCATGGQKYPSGTVLLLSLSSDQVSVSCRSSDSTGDLAFTKAN